MRATYRGNTYETNTKQAQERQAPVLTYRGVKYRASGSTVARVWCNRQADASDWCPPVKWWTQ